MDAKRVFNKFYFLTIGSSIICFILGLLIYLDTELALNSLSIIFGLLLMGLGSFIIVRYFMDGILRYLYGYALLYGILDIVTGILIISKPDIMTIVISLFISLNLIFEFISKIQISMILRNLKVDGWVGEIILAIILLVCSIIIIFNPIDGTLVITKIVSVIIMISSILNIVDALLLKNKLKNLKKSLKELFD